MSSAGTQDWAGQGGPRRGACCLRLLGDSTYPFTE